MVSSPSFSATLGMGSSAPRDHVSGPVSAAVWRTTSVTHPSAYALYATFDRTTVSDGVLLSYTDSVKVAVVSVSVATWNAFWTPATTVCGASVVWGGTTSMPATSRVTTSIADVTAATYFNSPASETGVNATNTDDAFEFAALTPVGASVGVDISTTDNARYSGKCKSFNVNEPDLHDQI